MKRFTKVKIVYLLLALALMIGTVYGCAPEAASEMVVITDNGGLSGGSEGTRPTIAPTDSAEPENTEPEVTDEATEEPAPTQKTSTDVDPDKPMIALTFDDGPHAPVTGRILDMLEQYHGKATFFIVGNRLTKSNMDVVKRAYALGCELSNHTWNHEKSLKGMNRDEFFAAVNPMDDALVDCVGIRTSLIRPVGGAYDENLLKITDRPFILWSVDTEDWRVREKNAIFDHIKKDSFDGAIVLMHDLREPTAEACEMAIPWLVEQGYQLVTVSELFEARGIELEAGKVYMKATPTPAPTPEMTEAPTETVSGN